MARSRGRGRAGGARGDGATLPALPAPEELDQLPLEELDQDLVLLHWPTPVERPLPRGLTAAERAVAQLASQGLSHEEIARARRRSVATIGNQLSSAYRKLGVGSRAALAARLAGRDGAEG